MLDRPAEYRLAAKPIGAFHILKAIHNGHFYASSGPEIKNICFEDGRVHVESSPVEPVLCELIGRWATTQCLWCLV